MSEPTEHGCKTFLEFMLKVDKALIDKCGLSHLDLRDWQYHDAFDDRMSIEHVVAEVLADNDHPDFTVA